jgi:hypothetical protein
LDFFPCIYCIPETNHRKLELPRTIWYFTFVKHGLVGKFYIFFYIHLFISAYIEDNDLDISVVSVQWFHMLSAILERNTISNNFSVTHQCFIKYSFSYGKNRFFTDLFSHATTFVVIVMQTEGSQNAWFSYQDCSFI